MTMHLVRGMSSLNTKKRKQKKAPGWKQAQADHEAFLKKMGVTGKKSEHRNELPTYKTGPRVTSDESCDNGTKREPNKYTGDYIIGIGTMHKSNMVPVTRKKDAEEMARMRRG